MAIVLNDINQNTLLLGNVVKDGFLYSKVVNCPRYRKKQKLMEIEYQNGKQGKLWNTLSLQLKTKEISKKIIVSRTFKAKFVIKNV